MRNISFYCARAYTRSKWAIINGKTTFKRGNMKRYLMLTVATLFCASAFIGCEEAAKQLTTTISGKVTNGGTAVSGAVVLVVRVEQTISEGYSLSNGSVSLADGKYTVLDADTGHFFIAAIDDVNDNFKFDADTDRIGYYGTLIDSLGFEFVRPETVTLAAKGNDIENIDIIKLFDFPF